MKTKTSVYPIYDLSNLHFQNAEIVTKENDRFKGQFVRFKVNGVGGQCIYPAEKYCFLPGKNKEEFWKEYNLNKGEFDEVPSYIKMLGLDELTEIIIKPVLVI